MGPMLDSN